MLLKLSGKLDSETHLRIKAFFLAASRLEAVSLAQCGEGRSFLQLLEKKARVLLWPLLLQMSGEHTRRVPLHWGCMGCMGCMGKVGCRTLFQLAHLFIGKAERFGGWVRQGLLVAGFASPLLSAVIQGWLHTCLPDIVK